MGRIKWSGSPVALARMKTTTDRMARATSDCSSRAKTKRSRLLARGELVEEQVVHDRARAPLAELLSGGVRGMQVDDRHPEVLASHSRVDVPHQGVDLVPVGLADDLGDHAVHLGVVHGAIG